MSKYIKNNDTSGVDAPVLTPDNVTFHYFEEMEQCIKGANLIICGVSSFGMEWFCNNVIPKLPADIPLLSISNINLSTDVRCVECTVALKNAYAHKGITV